MTARFFPNPEALAVALAVFILVNSHNLKSRVAEMEAVSSKTNKDANVI